MSSARYPRNSFRPFARAFLLSFSVVVVLAGVAPLSVQAQAQAAPAAETDARYQTTVEQAVKEFSLGNWAEARALFRRAHALSPSARTFRGMGMAAFELKLYVDALRDLTSALADTQRPLTDEQRTQVQSLIDQSRAYVGRYQLVLEPATATAYVDGNPAQLEPGNVLLLSLGEHEVTANAEGYQEVKVPLRVEGGEDLVLKVALSPASAPVAATPAPLPPPAASAPAEKPAPKKSGTVTTVGWIAAVGAVAFAGGAAAFWFVGEGKYSDLEKQCKTSGCTDKQIDDSGVKTTDTMSTVFLGLAGAAAITSVVCFVVGSSGDDAANGEKASLRIGPGSLALQGSF